MADEPAPNWRLLAPHRPLGPGDEMYVARPKSGGDAIAKWVAAGGGTVVVSGPTGVGKSTELAQAARVLSTTRVACLVQVDRMANMHRLTADELMHLIAQRLVSYARDELHLAVSDQVVAKTDAGPTGAQIHQGRDVSARRPFQTSGLVAAKMAITEIERLSHQGRIALLIDGMEKLPHGPDARESFDAFAQLPESIDLVAVIPWHAAFGSGTESILRGGEHWHRITALDTIEEEWRAIAEFLGGILAGRLRHISQLPESMTPLLGRAFKASGGLPRVFLQLVADAGTYARIKRGAAWPDDSDLSEAISDQEQSFRRILSPGDGEAINMVLHTDGRELELSRRIRLLAQGVLLERERKGEVRLEAHPLVLHALEKTPS